MFSLTVDTQSSVPMYKQAALSVKLEILAGRLGNGDALPGVGDMAKITKIHPTTVEKAYVSLEEDGFAKRNKSGHTVTFLDRNLDNLKKVLIEEEFHKFISSVLEIGATKDEIKKLVTDYLKGERK
ncbi:MAG: GntR family transcriptional regulator [bacterium]|nr:GntR family transcriptional regulator [bacterium]